MNPPAPANPAPADTRPHARWSAGKTVIAYILMSALAIFSIWYIDREVPRGNQPASTPAAR